MKAAKEISCCQLCACHLLFDLKRPASSTGFPRSKWGLGNSRAREKREGGMMGTSGEWWEGKGERAFSLLPNTPFVPAFLNNELKYPSVIASDWERGSSNGYHSTVLPLRQRFINDQIVEDKFFVLLVIDVIKPPGTYFNNWLQLSCRSSKFSSSFPGYQRSFVCSAGSNSRARKVF